MAQDTFGADLSRHKQRVALITITKMASDLADSLRRVGEVFAEANSTLGKLSAELLELWKNEGLEYTDEDDAEEDVIRGPIGTQEA